MSRERVHPSESIEAFAMLSARLDHPFAERTAVLGSLELTEQAFAALQQTWAERLSQDRTGLGDRFVDAYSTALSHSVMPQPAVAERVSSEQATSPRDIPEPAKVIVPSFMQPPEPVNVPVQSPSRPSGFGETGPVDIQEVLKPSVPFDPHAPSKMIVATAKANPSEKAKASYGTETVELDISVFLRVRPPVPAHAEKTLPLDAPGSPAHSPPSESPGPSRRLVRFDPQTGTPLAVPYWQDLPGSQENKG